MATMLILECKAASTFPDNWIFLIINYAQIYKQNTIRRLNVQSITRTENPVNHVVTIIQCRQVLCITFMITIL